MNLQTARTSSQTPLPPRPALPVWPLIVAGAQDLTPNIRRIELLTETSMPWRPGQDVVLEIPQGEAEPARRHYSIRRLNLPGRELALDIVRHGQGGPGERWAERARPGHGHAYLLAETATVRIIRHGLLARGLAKDQITAEGYWRPGRQGGHDHIRDEAA